MAGNKKSNMGELLLERARDTKDQARRPVKILDEKEALEVARATGASIHDVYVEALRREICPHRYLRNRETLTMKDQLTLAESRAAVIGAGGLGGHVIMLLARVGLGHLVVVDSDVFDESNLNRQALSSVRALGSPKCREAAEMVGQVNPGVDVSPYHVRFEESNGPEILAGCDVAVDALDNIASRFVVERVAGRLRIPMVHGALAGLEGQFMTIFPGDPGLSQIYRDEGRQVNPAKSPEAVLGVPTLTPSVIATFQAMEVLKVLLNRQGAFRNVLVHLDLEAAEIHEFRLSGDAPNPNRA